MPETLLLGVGLDERDLLLRASRELQVGERLHIDWEDRTGRAELGRHIADRRAVGDRQADETGTVELDEHPDHATRAQHLRDREHEIGRGRALRQLSMQAHAEHLRDQHRHRLAEHRGLGLDAANAPAKHAETVDHRCVGVGADERVGVGLAGLLVLEDDPREVLEVDLVHDPRVGRHHREVVEGALSPAQEGVALLVALELALGIETEGVARTEGIDLDGVVDHELGRRERIDLGGVAAHLGHRVAHRGKVDHGGHAGEVLHQHPCRGEGDLLARLRLHIPAGERLDVGCGD